MSIDPIVIPNPTPADVSWPDFPIRGTSVTPPIPMSWSPYLRVDALSVTRLPNNVAIVAVASQDATLLSQPLTTDDVEIARREASRVFLISTIIGSAQATPALCGTIIGNPAETYCTLPYVPTNYVDVTVPSAVWNNTSYTHIWALDGDLAGRSFAIDSQLPNNVWRLLNLGELTEVIPNTAFNFVAYGDTAPTAPTVSAINPLPYITVGGTAVSAISPQVASSANIVPTPSTNVIYVVAEAPVGGAYQLFLYCQQIGVTQFSAWKQLTFDGENRNPRCAVDSDGNLHIVWETTRCPVSVKEYAGLCYGVLGPSSIGLVNETFISALDKQAQLIIDQSLDAKDQRLDKSDLQLAYTDQLLDYSTPTALNLRELDAYGVPIPTDAMWETAIESGGTATVTNDTTISVTGNASSQRFGAFACLNRDENGNSLSNDFLQYHYQIAFDLTATSSSITSNLSEADIEQAYITWLAGFTPVLDGDERNVSIYAQGGVNYTVSRPERFYGSMCPIAGSYKYSAICLDLSTANAVPSDLRHFVLGIVPEQYRYRATSLTDSSVTLLQQGYTGNFKLAMILETSANISDERLGYQRSHSVRLFGGTYKFGTSNNFKIAVSYERLHAEQVQMRTAVDQIAGVPQDVRFTGSVIVAVNNVVQGAENFVPDFSDNYWSFDIGLGCPTVGEFRTGDPVPYDSGKWLNLPVSFSYANVAIGPHSMVPNAYLTAFDIGDRNVATMMTFDVALQDVTLSLTGPQAANMTDAEYALTFGNASLSQVPLTFEGKNTAPGICLDGCDKLHVAYQSNRHGEWDIFYAGAGDQGHPFRFDTRITNSNGKSLAPSIAIDEQGHRLIVWHDNRDGPYQIYAARSLTDHTCLVCDNQSALIEEVEEYTSEYDPTNPYSPFVSSICEINFQFTNPEASSYYFHFRLNFYQDEGQTQYYRSIDSSKDISDWFINGQQLGYEGVFVSAGATVTITYDASGEDDLSGQVFFASIESNNGGGFSRVPGALVYYCPATELSRCTLPCTYTNDTNAVVNVHFIVTAYRDVGMSQAVLSANSSTNAIGWVSGSNAYPSGGLPVPPGATISAFYNPQFLPPELFDQQNTTSPQTLLCNVRYYVGVSTLINSTTVLAETYALQCNCEDTDAGIWRTDDQSGEWLCSAQGADDRRLTNTTSHSLFPVAAASQDGAIYFAWEDQRYSDQEPKVFPDIYYGVWDSINDLFYCSGQGYYDRRLTQDGSRYYKPKLLVSSLQQPAFFYSSATSIKMQVVSLSATASLPSRPVGGSQGVFPENILPLTDSDLLCFSIDVADESLVRKYHQNSDTPISLVSDCVIKLEVHGPTAAKAVRFKNESDTVFSDWLQILPELPAYGDSSMRSMLDAYAISEDRFIATWVLSAGNGTKTVSAQVMTGSGITPAFSQEILAAYDELSYSVEFFSTSDLAIALPVFGGYPVVSTKRLAASTIQQNDVSTIATSTVDVSAIFIRVTFDDPKKLSDKIGLTTIQKFAELGSLSFDIIQQGTERQIAQPLSPVGDLDANGVPISGAYTGSFAVQKSDDYRRKDGLGIVLVHVPTPCFDDAPITVEDCDTPTELSPDDIRNQQVVDANAHVISLERFRYQYNEELLCSFTSNQCVEDAQVPTVDTCNLDDWIIPPATANGLLKDGSGLTEYFRQSPVYTVDLTDIRITGLILGSTTDIEGIVFIVAGNSAVTATTDSSGITYTLPAGSVALGATEGFYRYPPSSSQNGTSAKSFVVGSTTFAIAAGDNSVPVSGSGTISSFPIAFLPTAVVSGIETTIPLANLTGMISGEELIFRFIHVSTGVGHACMQGMKVCNNCTLPIQVASCNVSMLSGTSVQVTWTATTGATSYYVDRTPDNGLSYSNIAIIASPTLTYTDNGLTDGINYGYRIRGNNSCGFGIPSPTVYETSLVCTSFSWSVARQAEPYFLIVNGSDSPTYNPPTDAWIHESGDGSISLSDHRVWGIAFGDTVALDDVLVLMHAGDHIQQTWDGIAHHPVTFTLPENAIVFANTYGCGINKPDPNASPPYNASPQKTFLQTGTSNIVVWAQGTSLNNGTGNANDFINAGFYVVNFAEGVSKAVLEARGFIDGSENFNFNFGHILGGIGELANFTFTCTDNCPSGISSPCSASASPSGLAAVVTNTTVVLNWTDTNAGAYPYIIERQQNGGTWSSIHTTAAGATSYTDTTAVSGINYCYRIVTLDCTNREGQGVCSISLLLNDIPSNPTECGDLHVIVSGVDLQFTIVSGTIQIYAGSSGSITVTLDTDNPDASCFHILSPEVNGVTRLWASGASTITDTRQHSGAQQHDTIALSSGDRLQLLLTHSGGSGCVNGTHDDQAGRATWTIENCSPHGQSDTAPSATACVEAGCPTVCNECCGTYTITLSGGSILNGVYTLPNVGLCNWSDGTEFNTIRQNGSTWILTIGTVSCQYQWTAPCTGCPPTTGWTIDNANTSCSTYAVPALGIVTSNCSRVVPPYGDVCNIDIFAYGGNEGYSQTIDISGGFSAATILQMNFVYNTGAIADRIVITSALGNVLFDTGCVASSGASFFYCSVSDSPLHVQVFANCNGTNDSGWHWELYCNSVSCTPTVPLAPPSSLISPTSACSSLATTILWQNYLITPATCNCGSFGADTTGNLIYQSSCTWQSTDSPAWQLSYDGTSTWTLTRGISPVLWTGTLVNSSPIGNYTRTAGVDPLASRAVSVPCQTCPGEDGSNEYGEALGCCDMVEVIVSGASANLNGVWTLTRFTEEPFWSSGFGGGSKPAGASGAVQMTIKCDGFNWVLATVNDNTAVISWKSALSDCPLMNSASWMQNTGPSNSVLTIECLDCSSKDCSACPNYLLTVSGFATCSDFNGAHTLSKQGCSWSVDGTDNVTLTCVNNLWTLQITAAVGRYAIATQSGVSTCPPTGSWAFTTVGCGGESGTGTLS